MQTFISAPWWPIVVPLLGAVLLLFAGPRLPRLARRLIAVVAIGIVLFSLPSPDAEGYELPWSPLNLFRLGPELEPDTLLAPLLLSLGVALLAVTLSPRLLPGMAVGGLIGLAAVATLAQSANLLTLAMASSLLDLALALVAIRNRPGADRAGWQVFVPGVASTLLLLLATVHMDAIQGTASLGRESIPPLTLNLMLAAGLLRLLPFPIHPRAPQEASDWMPMSLSLSAGVSLLLRLEWIAPGWGQQPVVLGIAWTTILAGALLAALGQDTRRLAGLWLAGSGSLAWLTAWGEGAFPILLPALLWALLLLGLWFAPAAPQGTELWHTLRGRVEGYVTPLPWPPAVRSVGRQMRAIRWRIVPPLLALASLLGVPLSAGLPARLAHIRLTVAAAKPGLVALDLLSASLLAVGVLALGRQVLAHSPQHARPGTMAALALLGTGLFWLGIAPQSLQAATVARPDLPWLAGAAMTVAPWLLGAGLYVLARRAAHRWRAGRQFAWQLLRLQWLGVSLGWLGRQVAAAGWWVGSILEGGGAMGWALFLLALAATLFLVQ